MVVVITNPVAIANEHTIINQLFDEGLEVLHLRKPDYVIDQTETLLKKIDRKHYSKIALHQHHALVEAYQLKRIHYTEESRAKIKDADLKEHKDKFITLSTSIHQIDQYNTLSEYIDYCFFGPVFNSLSKQGYQSVINDDFKLSTRTSIKIIALGGIDEDKIDTAKNLGFSGIALLGALWQTKNPVEQFKRIQRKWLMKENMY